MLSLLLSMRVLQHSASKVVSVCIHLAVLVQNCSQSGMLAVVTVVAVAVVVVACKVERLAVVAVHLTSLSWKPMLLV